MPSLIERFRNKDKQEEDIKHLFLKVKQILEFIFSPNYYNEENQAPNLRDIVSEKLIYLRTNKNDILKYFNITLVKDNLKGNESEKKLMILGKFTIQFFIFKPFLSNIIFNNEKIYCKDVPRIREVLDKIYFEIYKNIIKNFKIKLKTLKSGDFNSKR